MNEHETGQYPLPLNNGEDDENLENNVEKKIVNAKPSVQQRKKSSGYKDLLGYFIAPIIFLGAAAIGSWYFADYLVSDFFKKY